MTIHTAVLLLVLSVLSTGVSAQDKPKPVTIKGTFSDAPSTKVYLGYYEGGKTYLKDSSFSDATGRFTFTSNELHPQGQYMIMFPEKESIYADIYLGKDQQFAISASLSDIQETVVVTGSEDSEAFYGHMKQLTAMRREVEALQKRREAFITVDNADSATAVQKRIEAYDKRYYKLREDMLNRKPANAFTSILGFQWRPQIPESLTDQAEIYHYYKAHYFDKADWTSPAIVRSSQLLPFLNEYLDNLTVSDADSVIAACNLLLDKASVNDELFQLCLITLVNKYAGSQIICFDKVYVHLVDHYYSSGRAVWMTGENLSSLESMQKAADRKRPCLCGTTAYNFNLKNRKGALTELRKIPGKYTLLVFYNPVRERDLKTLKSLGDMRALLEKKGVAMTTVLMHYEVQPATWEADLQKTGTEWCTNLQVANEQEHQLINSKFDTYYSTKIYILDEQKRILYKDLDAETAKQIVSSFPDK